MSDTKAVVKSVDMSEEMQQEAIECSTQALEKYNIEKDIAAHIKREFDRKYGKEAKAERRDNESEREMKSQLIYMYITRTYLALCCWSQFR